jgi:hypothetical protein
MSTHARGRDRDTIQPNMSQSIRSSSRGPNLQPTTTSTDEYHPAFPQHTWTPQPSLGTRSQPLLLNPRGVCTRFGCEAGFEPAMAAVLQYAFQDADLLEEALESAGSGVVVVGRARRECLRGNLEMGAVGEGVVRLVLREQCYLFRIPEGESRIPQSEFSLR